MIRTARLLPALLVILLWALALQWFINSVPTFGQTQQEKYSWNIPTKPCKYEDSKNCFWDAGQRGDGKGHSFWVGRNNKVHYLDPTFRRP